jgi:acyl-CoA reductase-like NAD-dependent aldehyde dehydrogenase
MAVFAAAAWVRPAAPTPPPERHPHIHAALVELREAKAELQSAAHDFCGRRVEAIHNINQTIHQLDLALACDRK